MKIILCGFATSGKTTLGKRVAEKLGWGFVDIDALIIENYRLKTGKQLECRQIFLEEGNANFRELEKKAITSLEEVESPCVIAVGGGAVCDTENVEQLKSIGYIVYLKVPSSELWKRIQKRGIPAYLDPNDPKTAFEELEKQRLPFYEAAADFVIEASDSTLGFFEK